MGDSDDEGKGDDGEFGSFKGGGVFINGVSSLLWRRFPSEGWNY